MEKSEFITLDTKSIAQTTKIAGAVLIMFLLIYGMFYFTKSIVITNTNTADIQCNNRCQRVYNWCTFTLFIDKSTEGQDNFCKDFPDCVSFSECE